MKKTSLSAILLILICTRLFSTNENEIRSVIHLIDYVSNDYSGAVLEGKIISQQEYSELTEFNTKMLTKAHEIQLDTDANLNIQLLKFSNMIFTKANIDSVRFTGNLIKNMIVTRTGFISYPTKWFDLENAKTVYLNNCAKCHGQDGTGNGLDGAKLDPKPRNFYEEERMRSISPSNAFNTIRLGIEGTGMKGFPGLTDNDAWDLAFYVVSLRYSQYTQEELLPIEAKFVNKITLEQLSENSDVSLMQKFKINDKKELAALRSCVPQIDKKQYLQIAKSVLAEAYSAYINKDYPTAENKGVAAYLEGIEPVELQIKSLQPHLVAAIEKQMMLVRKNINDRVDNQELNQSIMNANSLIDKASVLLQSEKKSAWWMFFMSYTIIIREALEAMLILVIIINLIRSANAEKAMKWIHLGWISALLIGILAWLFSEKLVSIGMGKIEIFEGIVSLFAVLVVLYIGFWMHSHTEIGKWKSFVNDKIGKLIDSGNYKGLALLAFVVVGREVFESVLFLTAISANKTASGTAHLPVIGGALLSVITVLIIAYIFINISKNIPIRKLLRYSSIVLGVLAIMLIGKAAHSFQETGFISIHSLPFDYKNDLLGIYPTIETTFLQLIILTLVAYFLFFNKPKPLSNKV